MKLAQSRSKFNPEVSESPQSAPVFVATMTREQFKADLRDAVTEHMTREPVYVDDAGLAARLVTGLPAVRRLAAENAPHLYVGDRRRWHVATIDAYLAARGPR